MGRELAAIPDAASRFIGFGDDDQLDDACVFHLDRDSTVSAVFEAL